MGIPVVLKEGDFQVYRFDGGLEDKPPHRRNDHFLFIFQESGKSEIFVDGNEVKLANKMLLCISPGQVYETLSVSDNTTAWIVTAGVEHVKYHFPCPALHIDELSAGYLAECLALLNKMNTGFHEVRISLLDACIGMIAEVYKKNVPAVEVTSRRRDLTAAFKRLVLLHFREMKSAGEYAGKLNITPSYLNEVVKAATGSPVSFWVQQAVVAEARRLLSGTDLTIKEIAFSIGYHDQGYFTRYFTNATGESPQAFRTRNRK
ncbi:AraC family transcriptional regulator [Chitinophaga sp.]|uniref:AraC family transcriptional regulator n=1 Tax=Chitinophaga sp. TaxID=1869181 RepID=UPI0031D313E8